MDETRRLPIRATVARAYAIVWKAPIKMFGLAAVPLVGLVLLAWLAFQMAELVANGATNLVYLILAGYLVQYALLVLILGALVRGAADVDCGKSFDVASSLVVGLYRLPQLLGASLYLFIIGTSAFFGLFSQPPHIEYALPPFFVGIVYALLLALSIPVCLIERRGPIAGTMRALRVGRGSRLRLVAALLIASVPILGVTILLMSFASYLIVPLLAALCLMMMSAVLIALITVAYRELARPETTAAAVFD